jgi:hypothetical protein
MPLAGIFRRTCSCLSEGSLINLSKKLLVLFLLASNVAFTAPPRPALTAQQWRQDLDSLVQEITANHRDPYHSTSKTDFDRAVADLRERIPSMKDYEIMVGLQRLAALIGDGHTFLDTSGLYARFPLQGFWFGNDLRVVRTAPEYREALGARIVSIGSVPIHEAQGKIRQLIQQGENEWYVLNSSAKLLMQVEPLAAQGILPRVGPTDFTFEDDSGRRFKLRIRPVAAGASGPEMIASDPVPLPFQRPNESLWFTYLPDSRTVYANFRSFRDLQTQAAKLWDYVGGLPANRLIIDMRWNEGGNYAHGREYLVYKLIFMPALNRAGHLFIVTGRGTFSAGMTNVTDLRRETEAILVGEPTGARPNAYQENHMFTLPFSKLRASCAKLRYRFQPELQTEAVMPDETINPDWVLFKAGKDAALQWILARQQ